MVRAMATLQADISTLTHQLSAVKKEVITIRRIVSVTEPIIVRMKSIAKTKIDSMIESLVKSCSNCQSDYFHYCRAIWIKINIKLPLL